MLLSVGAGLYALFQQSHKATEQMKQQAEAAKKAAKEMEALKSRERELAAAGGDLTVKMTALSTEFQSLQTKAEKQQWIEENQTRFNQLGFSIDSVKQAEDVFVKNTGAVISAMVARARAMKMIDQAVDQLGDLDKKFADMDRQFEAGATVSNSGKYVRRFKRGMDLSDDEAKRAGVRTKAERTKGVAGAGAYATTKMDDFTDQEIAKINANRQKEGRAAKKAVQDRYQKEKDAILQNVQTAVKAQLEADKKLYSIAGKPKTATAKSGGAGKTKKEETPEAGSLADLRKQRAALQKIQENGTYKKHKTNADEVEKEIRRLDQMISDEEFIIDFNTDPAKVSLETIERQYNKMYAQARTLGPDDAKKANQNVKTVNQVAANKRYEAGLDIKPAEDALISLQQKADSIFAQMQNKEIFGTDTFKDLEKQYNDALSEVNNKKLELGIDTQAAEGSIDDLQSKIFALLGQRNALTLDVDTESSRRKIEEIDAQISELNSKLSGSASELKINTESAHVSIKAMEDRVSLLKSKLNLDVTLDVEGQKEIVNEILKIEKDIKAHKIKIGLETDPSIAELDKIGKQAQEAMKPKQKSSFEQAVPAPAPAKNDYEGQLRQIQSVMDANDAMYTKLEEIKGKYEEMGATGEESYQKIIDKMGELKSANDELADQAKETDKADKKAKKRQKNWQYAADAVGNFGDALSSIGDAAQSPELNVAGVIAQTMANLALSASQAIAQSSSMGPWGWIAFSILAMA